ncbi:hypothetical protein AWENTII_008280 [Aspergillus wentii]
MKECLECESNSTTYKSPTENDLYYFLFNQQWTVQYCLFEHSTQTSAWPQCQSNCSGIQDVLEHGWNVNTNNAVGQYDYCKWNGSAFGKNVGSCASCLGGVPGSVTLSNFLLNLETACNTQPNSSKNDTLKLSRPLFYTPWEESESSGLSTGAKAGIGVGVGVGGILVIAGVVWVILRRRGQKQHHERIPQEEEVKNTGPSEMETPANHLELHAGAVAVEMENTARQVRTVPGPPSELPVN